MSTITDYGPVLAPDAASLSSRIAAWFDAADPACFPGGVLPADNAAVTTWTDKLKGVTLNRTSSGTTYRTSLRGRAAVYVGDGGAMQADNFFGDGTGWDGYGIYALAWHRTKDLSSSSGAANAIRSGPTASVYMHIGSNPSSGEINLNGSAWGNGGPWSALGLVKNVGSEITVGGVAGRLNRVYCDGSMQGSDGGVGNLTVNTPNLNLVSSAGSGIWAASDIVIVKGYLSWVEALQLGLWMMQRAAIPRKPGTFIPTGNSLSESYGYHNTLRARVLDNTEDGQCEVINMAKSGGTSTTLADGATDLAAVLALTEAQGRRAVISAFWGANDGGWPSNVENQYRNYLAAARLAGHRTVAIGLTPARAYNNNGPLAASDAYIAGCVPADHDDAFRPYQTPWGSQWDNPAVTTGAVSYDLMWGDTIHLNAIGYSVLAAALGPKVLNQVRCATAARATCSGSVGSITVTRHADDAALADDAVRIVAAGSAAPTTAATAIGTVPKGQASGVVTAPAGTWDVYLSQAESTPVRIGSGVVVTAVPVPYTAAANVRAGTDRGDGVTGTMVAVSPANTKTGVAADGGPGTYDGSDRWTALDVGDVRLGEAYKANSPTPNRVGSLKLPAPDKVLDGEGYGEDGDELVGTLEPGSGGGGEATLAPATIDAIVDRFASRAGLFEPGETGGQTIRLIRSAAAGKVDNQTEHASVFRRADGVTPCFTATTDEAGNRSIVVAGGA